jgi:hypothetical protein
MKVWTVTEVSEDAGVSPFAFVYTSHKDAIQAVEAHALELFEAMVDPNDGDKHSFTPLNWNDDMTEASDDESSSGDAMRWIITAADVSQ